VLISQCLADEEDMEGEARATVRFLLRALTLR
jgi:hypothetical protein